MIINPGGEETNFNGREQINTCGDYTPVFVGSIPPVGQEREISDLRTACAGDWPGTV
jgi:hypothetical protein